MTWRNPRPAPLPLLLKDGLPDALRNRLSLFLSTVPLPWPEEAAQPILVAARDDVSVKVRHALAHPVVDGDKRAVRAQRPRHYLSEQPDVGEQGREQPVGYICQCLDVGLWDEQTVTGEHRTLIEEGETRVVVKHNMGVEVAPGDAAEGAGNRSAGHAFCLIWDNRGPSE